MKKMGGKWEEEEEEEGGGSGIGCGQGRTKKGGERGSRINCFLYF